MLKERLIKWLLPQLVKEICPPNRIPRTGEEGKRINCFSIFLEEKSTKKIYLIRDFDKKTYKFKALAPDNQGAFKVEANITFNEIMRCNLRVNHYYGLYEFEYSCIYKLAFCRITRFHKLQAFIEAHLEGSAQSRFNKRKLNRMDSIELLKFMLDLQISELSPNSSISSAKGMHLFILAQKLYSLRWSLHPDSSRERHRLELHLEALVTSGDLTKTSDGYIVKGQALKTIEKYDEDERRHKDTICIQRILAFLTLILAITSLIALLK